MLERIQPRVNSILIFHLGFPGGSLVKNLPGNAGDVGSIPGQEGPLEKEIATHSSIVAWEMLWTEEPGGLQSIGYKRVRHDLATKQQLHASGLVYINRQMRLEGNFV